MDGKLRALEGALTLANFPSAIGEAAAGISIGNIRSYFAHCYYHVPELARKVYMGDQ